MRGLSSGLGFSTRSGGSAISASAPSIAYAGVTYSVVDPDGGTTYQWYYRGEIGGDQLIVGETGTSYVGSDIDAGRLIAVKDVGTGLFSNVIVHYLAEPVTLEQDFTAANGTLLSTLGFTMAGGNPADYSKFQVLANRFKMSGTVVPSGSPATWPYALVDTTVVDHYVEWVTTALVGSNTLCGGVLKFIDEQNYLQIDYANNAVTVKPRVANTLGLCVGYSHGWRLDSTACPIGTKLRIEAYSNNTVKLFVNDVAYQQNGNNSINAFPGDVAYSFNAALAAGSKVGIGGGQYSLAELDDFKTGPLNKQIWLQAVSIIETATPPIERRFRGTGSLQSGAATQLQTALVRDDGLLLQGWTNADGITDLTFDVSSLAIPTAGQGHSVTMIVRDETNMQYATSYPFPVPDYLTVEATTLGINESYYDDWEGHYAVRDRALCTWPLRNGATDTNFMPPDVINQDGRITSFPAGTTNAVFRLFTTGVGKPGSEWICRWPEGWDAVLSLSGGATGVVKDAVARTIRFTLPADEATARTIVATVTPSGPTQTWPLEFTCYPFDDTETHLLASDEAVDGIMASGLGFVRFMTPMGANANANLNVWGQVVGPTATNPIVYNSPPGCNIQFMVELCNRAGVDLYWTPHICSDISYIEYVTDYCAANLNGKLMIELSNEIANSTFYQYIKSQELGIKRGLIGPVGDLGPQPLRERALASGVPYGNLWAAVDITEGDLVFNSANGGTYEALQNIPRGSGLIHPSGSILFTAATASIGANSVPFAAGTTRGHLVAGDTVRIRQGNTVIQSDLVLTNSIADVYLGGTIEFTPALSADLTGVNWYIETQDNPYSVEEGAYWTQLWNADEAKQAGRRFRSAFSKEIFQTAYDSYGVDAPTKVERIVGVFGAEASGGERQKTFDDLFDWGNLYQYTDSWTTGVYIGGSEAGYDAGKYSSQGTDIAGVWDPTVRSYYNTDYDRTAEGLLAYLKAATDATIALKRSYVEAFESYFVSKGLASNSVKFVVYEGQHHIVPSGVPGDYSSLFLTPFLNGEHMARFAQYYVNKYEFNLGGKLALFCRVSQYNMPASGNSSWGIQWKEPIEYTRPYGKVFHAFAQGKSLPAAPTLTVTQGATDYELVFAITPGSAGGGTISDARVMVQDGAHGGYSEVTASFAFSAGAWRATVTGFSPATAYTFKGQVTNEVGWSERSVLQDITTSDSDVTAPTITSADPSGSYVEGDPIGGTLTADETVTWAVTGTDAAAVTLDPDTGVWSLEETVYATQSSYSFSFVATDLSANDSDPQVVSITITESVTPSVRGFLAVMSSATPNTVHTFTAQPLGTPNAARYIVAVIAEYTAGSPTLTSLTIGGVTATHVVTAAVVSGNARKARMYIAHVPSGTTGDVVATYGATQDSIGIALHFLTDIPSATPLDTDTALGADAVFSGLSFSGPAHVIAGGMTAWTPGARVSSASADTTNAPSVTVDQTSTNVTWTGLTEDCDAQFTTNFSNQAAWVAAAWAKVG